MERLVGFSEQTLQKHHLRRHYLDSKPVLKSEATVRILSREHHLRSISLEGSRHLPSKKPKLARKLAVAVAVWQRRTEILRTV